MIPRLIVQDNLWFHGKSQGGYIWVQTGRTMIPVEPLLGRSDSRDETAKAQEYTWLGEATCPRRRIWNKQPERRGENLVIAYQWQAQGDFTDRNVPGALTVLKRTLPAAKFIIFYDPMLAVQQRELARETERGVSDSLPAWAYSRRVLLDTHTRGLGTRPDFARADHREMLDSDLRYLNRYFDDEAYWRLDGRPVLYLWAWGYGCRNTERTREILSRFYIVGDVFGGGQALRDCATGFVLQLPGKAAPRRLTVRQVLPEIETQCRRWAEPGYSVIPAASFQYDDHAFMYALGRSHDIRLLAENKHDHDALLELLNAHARPLPDGRTAIFVGTANNWAEGTTILPTAPGDEYPGGQIGLYGMQHLDALTRFVRRRYREG